MLVSQSSYSDQEVVVARQGTAKNGSWYAIRVKHQFENSVSTHLDNSGYQTVVPKYEVSRVWSDRVKTLARPLFPGFVFCQFDSARPRPIHSVPGVINIVSFGRKMAEVDKSEIEALRSVVAANLPASPWPYLKSGQKVRLEHGPLKGLIGHVVRDKNQHRLVLSVTLLNTSAAVEIDREWIHPLD